MSVAIKINNLGKSYKMYKSPMDRMTDLLGVTRNRHRDFWGLRGVSFEVKKGECIGIIGRNGSGKSTLLKVLCGLIQPSEGSVQVNGKISALLELGAGFHPEFTGRENVFMNGALMGLTRQEVESRFESIAEFAEIGDFLERPVKTYSSGMFLRLAFACAAHVDPDILIIDEALAVGDFKFRQKCSEKINEIKKTATVVIVSHSMRDITMLCSKAAVLDKSRLVYFGPAQEAVDWYLKSAGGEDTVKEKSKAEAKSKTEARAKAGVFGDFFTNAQKISDINASWSGSKDGVVSVENGDELLLDFSYNLLKSADNLIMGIAVYDWEGQMLTGVTTEQGGRRYSMPFAGPVEGRLALPCVFNPGKYFTVFSVLDGKEFVYRGFLGELNVRQMPVCAGLVTVKHKWEIRQPNRI